MDAYSLQLLIMNWIEQWSAALVTQVKYALVALVWFILGWLVAGEVGKLLTASVLRLVRWDDGCERLGLARWWKRVRPDLTPTAAAAEGVYWLLLATFTFKACEVLNLGWISWIGRLYFEFFPKALGAGGVLVGAYVLGRLGSAVIRIWDGPDLVVLAARLWQALSLALGTYAALLIFGADQVWARYLSLLFAGIAAAALAAVWVRDPWRLSPVQRVESYGEAE